MYLYNTNRGNTRVNKSQNTLKVTSVYIVYTITLIKYKCIK